MQLISLVIFLLFLVNIRNMLLKTFKGKNQAKQEICSLTKNLECGVKCLTKNQYKYCIKALGYNICHCRNGETLKI